MLMIKLIQIQVNIKLVFLNLDIRLLLFNIIYIQEFYLKNIQVNIL